MLTLCRQLPHCLRQAVRKRGDLHARTCFDTFDALDARTL
jgi:hypothetical protein